MPLMARCAGGIPTPGLQKLFNRLHAGLDCPRGRVRIPGSAEIGFKLVELP
jgi:hypothetical protein